MTVFDGIREKESEPDMWPEDLEKAPLSEATVDFSRRLRNFGKHLESEDLAPPYQMRVVGFERDQCGMGFEIVGATPEEERRMRRLRDRLADTLGFRAPNHERYRFHISVAYLLMPISGKDKAELQSLQASLLPQVLTEFELGAVEFCTFKNMEAYTRCFYLGE
jgi:hypothetical protein